MDKQTLLNKRNNLSFFLFIVQSFFYIKAVKSFKKNFCFLVLYFHFIKQEKKQQMLKSQLPYGMPSSHNSNSKRVSNISNLVISQILFYISVYLPTQLYLHNLFMLLLVLQLLFHHLMSYFPLGSY